MRVLVIGGGGREHALAWKCAQSPRVEQVFVAPGNAGTSAESKVENVDIAADDIDAALSFAIGAPIDLTIVGPEVPLVAGIVDRFQNAGLRCFGPTRSAARLEGSKSFAKDFLARHGIPTARYAVFEDADEAERYILEQREGPLVVKVDGLAAGKGVTVAADRAHAVAAVRECLSDRRFGDAGSRVVVEEFLDGEEASFICLVGGNHIVPLASSQDHKARDDGDRGPNTGGMGAYSPAPVVDDHVHAAIMHDVIEPTVAALAHEGAPYTGFLYAGLMVAGDGSIKVLEYNCRLGDPETQPVLMRMRTDLVDLCMDALNGALGGVVVQWDPRPALGVVAVAAGYPGEYETGKVITGLADAESDAVKVFHAGTRRTDDQVTTSGGRVLCVTALGRDIRAARDAAYGAVSRIKWEGMYYRSDIGHRAMDRAGWNTPHGGI